MGAVKITKFLGEAPKVSPELLPETAAQRAVNVKFYSGDIIPYRKPKPLPNQIVPGQAPMTLRGMRDPVTDAIKWLTWPTRVDVAVAAGTDATEQRFYYTGDGAPKASTFALATQGNGPYPSGYYELGLPLPTTIASVATTAFSPLAITHYARDSANTATVTFAAPHGLRTGVVVTVSGFDSEDTVANTFNAVNATATAVSTTQISYFSPGDAVPQTAAPSGGELDLAGNTQSRSYVFTWITPWDEESIASEPSDDLYLKEGQTVTVTNLPTSGPANTFVRGIRLYRTVTSVSGSEYFRLRTLWFPTPIARVERDGSETYYTTAQPHNLISGDRVKVSGCTDTNFNLTDVIVADVIDEFAFTVAVGGSAIADKQDTTGTLFRDVAEDTDGAARYWGDGSYTFTDDYDVDNLVDILDSDDYDQPPSDLQGITLANNGYLVGFFGNTVCFSVPNKPHAWPVKFRKTVEYDIVAITSIAGQILVLTTRYPYILSGSVPEVISVTRLDMAYPCLNAGSVVNMGYGVVWATHGGLAAYQANAGLELATRYVEDWETWDVGLDPTTVTGFMHNDKYYAGHSTGAFIFEQDAQTGGFLTRLSYDYTAAWSDDRDNKLYFTRDASGTIYEWDADDMELAPLEWRSKVLTTTGYMNLGAARILADFGTPPDEEDSVAQYNAQAATYNIAQLEIYGQLAPLNGPVDITEGGNRVVTHGEFNSTMIGGDLILLPLRQVVGELPVTFRLWVNKELIFQTTVYDSSIFRLPNGYKADTFEVAVSGSARVRAIHLGETPSGLRGV
jgi:hypothetical protein